MSDLLELKDVTAGYGREFLLRSVNIGIQRHKITGIIGPNGSGKTTLLKTISRIIKPEIGNIELNGTDIWKLKIKEFARKVAVISQTIDTVSIPVFDYVLMGRIPHHQDFQFFDSASDELTANQYIELTGIQTIREKPLDSISGGERQLAQFARALTQQPELLLMDEPTSHLDIKHQVSMLDLIRKYNRDTGLTIIIVLHDLNLASEYCDQLILLKEGMVRYGGTPSEVLNYQIIEEIYETVVIVERNPLSNKPYVFLISEEEMKKR